MSLSSSVLTADYSNSNVIAAHHFLIHAPGRASLPGGSCITYSPSKLLEAMLNNVFSRQIISGRRNSACSPSIISRHCCPLPQRISTPAPSEHPSRDLSFEAQRLEELYDASRNSQSALRDLVRARRIVLGFCCPVTGKYDSGVVGTPFVSAAVEEVRNRDLDLTLEAAHILPFKLNTTIASITCQQRDSTWKTIRLWGARPASLLNDNINGPLNAILMQKDVHQPFGQFKFGLRETSQAGVYDMEVFKQPRLNQKGIDLNPAPEFRAAATSAPRQVPSKYRYKGPDVVTPSPALIQLHYAIGTVLHASGAAESIGLWLRKWERMTVLASDWSSDLLMINARLSVLVH